MTSISLPSARIVCFWLIFLGFILRLPLLGGSFWLDEAAQALESARPLSQQLDIAPDFQPPFIHFWLHFAMLVSQSEWWLRFVSAVLPGLGTIYFFHRFSVIVWPKQWLSFLSPLLLTTSSFHIFFSQELRPYALPTFFLTASWWYLYTHLKDNSTSSIVTYTVLTISGMYSSYLYPFFMIGQVVYACLYGRTHLKFLVSSWTISSLAFCVWLPGLWAQLREGAIVRDQLPGWESVVGFTAARSLLLTFAKFLFGVLDVEPTISYISTTSAIVALVSLSYGILLQQLKLRKLIKSPTIQWKHFVLWLCWLVIPLLSTWIFSFFIPVLQPKRVLALLPAFYALALGGGLGLTKNRWLLGLVAVLILLVNLGSTYSYYTEPMLQRENWRDLHQTLVRDFDPQQTIMVFSFPEPFAPWRWYDRGSFPTYATGTLSLAQHPDLLNELKHLTQFSYIITFDYLQDLTDPNRLLNQELLNLGYRELKVYDYPNIGFVRVYAQPDATITYLPVQ